MRTDRLTGRVLCGMMAAAAAMIGCEVATEVAEEQPPITLEMLKSSVPRDTSPQVSGPDLAAVVAGNNEFGWELYRDLAGSASGNLVCSPWSVSVAMAMTWAGAAGATETQIAEGLHYTVGQAALHAALNRLDLDLSSRGQGASGREGAGFTLRSVNAAWPEKTYPFLDAYLDVLALNYGAGLYPMDFMGAPESSRVTINAWVAQETNDHILDLLPQGSITPLTRLVLTNAVYFDAAWQDTFNRSATCDQAFHLLDGGVKQAKTMHRKGGYRMAADSGWQALELPYDGGEMSMVIVLPDSGTFAQFEQQVSAQSMAAVCAGLTVAAEVAVAIPKFSYEYGAVSLADALQRMGVTDAFAYGLADFSGMDGTRELYISDVVHKAFVAVDEKGTTAAAATGVIVGTTSMPLESFTADRPFIYFIRDNLTGQVVFVGRVVDPTA